MGTLGHTVEDGLKVRRPKERGIYTLALERNGLEDVRSVSFQDCLPDWCEYCLRESPNSRVLRYWRQEAAPTVSEMVQPRDSRGSDRAGNFHQKLRFRERLVASDRERWGERAEEMYRGCSFGAQQWVKPAVLTAAVLGTSRKREEDRS